MNIQSGKGSGDSSPRLHVVTAEGAQMGLQSSLSVRLTHGCWVLVVSGVAGSLSWKIFFSFFLELSIELLGLRVFLVD